MFYYHIYGKKVCVSRHGYREIFAIPFCIAYNKTDT